MEKPTIRRLGLGFVQHIALALGIMIVVSIAQKSVIQVENLYGETKYHQIDIYENIDKFEDTAVFSDMFDNAVSDLMTLVVIKGQLETDGIYDGAKLIDVTAFVNRREVVSQCPITAVYTLDNLVKWSKNGITMGTLTLSKKDFVNFFRDNMVGIEHFYLDEETGNLKYRGDLTEGTALEQELKEQRERNVVAEAEAPQALELQEEIDRIILEEKKQKLLETYNNYLQYNEEELVDMAFSYLVSHMDKPVTLSTEEEEELVHLEMVKPKYATVDGKTQLLEIADNWLDYCRLENNLIDTIESLTYNYTLYESRNDLYAQGNTNLSYLVRVPQKDGYIDYTNMAGEFLTEDTGEIDNYFEDIGKFISYSVDDIECVGNVDISDEEMYSMVETHKYAYPEGTRIWIGVDVDFHIEGDQFETGYRVFNGIIPRMKQIILLIGVCLAVWLIIWSYLTYTAGWAYDENGNHILYLNGFDRLYTEFVAALGCVQAYYGIRIFGMIMSLALEQRDDWFGTFAADVEIPVGWYLSGIGALYGFLISFFFSIMWYSLVRRIKGRNLWKDSFLHWLWEKCYKGAAMVLYHRSVMIRTMIPYNLFLLINLFGLAGAYAFSENRYLFMTIGMGLLLFDALIGVLLFRKNAEMADIVDAIKRIRQGEVECQLEADKLHGENKEIAEAVNNIGEGIKNAVATSLKDERMKTDLITNVSHDIKTPLTSIINYVDLLKRQKIKEEPVRSYIDILDGKSQRLKQLTDDLVEASKISSGNIVLNREKLNLTELLNQSLGEFSEKFEEKDLQVVFEHAELQAFIYADSRRMWRIIENLFNNIYKYAMPVTRVYIYINIENGKIKASLKNISEKQLNIHSDELTERFIRGDVSRTTEGSGLGLYIAKSLTKAQGGDFDVYLDGDLFKVTLSFPQYTQELETFHEPQRAEEPDENRLTEAVTEE